MERLKKTHPKILKAYASLEKVITKHLNTGRESKEELLVLQDSIIKRFEYCYELTWKYLKLYLDDKFGLIAASPKKVFQECLKQNVITEKEAEQFLAMVDDRNLTTHTYDESLSDKITAKIPAHYSLMKKVLEKLKP